MAEGNDLHIDQLLVNELPGPQKISALLKARGFTIAGYARHRGFWPEHVKQTLSGDRPGYEVREALSEDLGLARDEIDRLIDGEVPRERARIPA